MKNKAAVALGSIKTEKKSAAARVNGAKGKRPDVIKWSTCNAWRIFWSNNGLPATEIISTDGARGGDMGILLTGEIDGKKAEKFIMFAMECREDGKFYSTGEVDMEALRKAKNAVRAKLRRMMR